MLKTQTKKRLKKIINLALPSGVNAFLDIFVIAVNMLFMSYIDDAHTLAMGISLNFLMLFYAVNAVFSIGTSAQISRYFGAREYQRASSVLSSVALGGLLLSLPLVLVGYFGGKYFFEWLGVSAQVRDIALEFNTFAAFALPAMIIKNIFTSAFSSIGNTLYPLLVRSASVVFSIALTYWFVLVWGQGMVGAGVAYLIAVHIDIVIFGILFLRKGGFFKAMPFERDLLLKALRIGLPAGIERLLTLFSLVLTTKIIATFSDWVLTGAQIGTRIEAFSFMPGFGFMLAAMVLMGQNLGARKVKLAALYVRTTLIFSSIVMGISGVILVLFAREFSLIFSSHEEVVSASIAYLIAVGLSQIPLIWAFVLDGALRGAGNTKVALFINAGSIWCFRIMPMGLLVVLGFGIEWVFGVICVETYIRAAIFWRVFKKGVWKRVGSEV